MESNDLGTAPRQLLEEMAEVRSLDVVLPTGAGTDLHLRTVSRPEKHLAILPNRLGPILPGRARRIGNGVEKTGREIERLLQMGSSSR